ncbi:MAG TPA: hypothetical protein VGT06_03905 [Candidatus Methylomirabilis sp.]|jgi:hypothetical protein|nr:hypothetical protein [Candidatus Methylomirabilis sp.]
MSKRRACGLVTAGILGAVLLTGPATPEEPCGAVYPHIKDSQLKVAVVAQTPERFQARLRNTDPSITAKNTTVLVTFWNAANQPIESSCVRLGDVRPGQEADFEVTLPGGTARISAGAQSTWDR